jgi:riboflavin biosynthesis pyrimidine reductase
VLGGGELARSLFEGGLIDEVGLNVHPVLLGSGVPLFLPMSRPVELTLRECRVLKSDCVLLRYGVKRVPGGRAR